MRNRSFVLTGWASSLALAAGVLGAQGAQAQVDCETRAPIIFVHGAAGNASQYLPQVLRFASNGFDPDLIAAFEYDSPRIGQIMGQVLDGIDALADDLRQRSGCDQVNLVGHSLGTFVSQRYLARPQSAARVLNYVNADGAGGSNLPVPTLALTAGDAGNRSRVTGPDATNVNIPGALHIGAVSGVEAFVEMHRLITGRAPQNPEALVATTPQVAVQGRASIFQSNAPTVGAMLSVFELNERGTRATQAPLARTQIGQDGLFGPFQVSRGVPVEFLLERQGQLPQSFISEGFEQDTRFLRLSTTNQSAADRASFSNRTAGVVVSRNREFQSGGSVSPDQLLVDGQNVINPRTVRCCAVGAAPAALVLGDAGGDGRNDLTGPAQGGQGFVAAIDVVMDPSQGPTEFVLVPRGDQRLARTLVVQLAPASERRFNLLLREADAPGAITPAR